MSRQPWFVSTVGLRILPWISLQRICYFDMSSGTQVTDVIELTLF